MLLQWRVTYVVICVGISSLLVVVAAKCAAADGRGVTSSSTQAPDAWTVMANWDGRWFCGVARSGYAYEEEGTPSFGFFPAYPLFGRVLTVSGLSAEASLVILSNGLLLAAMLLFAAYVKLRILGEATGRSVVVWSVLSVAFFPTTFFFHMAYSESMLLFLLVLAMYGMRRNWPPLAIAAIIGLATATKAVGVALLVPFVFYLWNRSRSSLGGREAALDLLGRGAVLLPVACWGLLAYMAYQAWAFDDPLAFTEAEMRWHDRYPPESKLRYAADLLTLEPVWAVYTRDCPCYWGRRAPHDQPLLNLQFANPIYFLGTAALIALGAWKGWIDRYEWTLSAALLLIPYLSNAYRMCMTSHARFAAVVFPAYIVMGHLLARMPKIVAVLLLVGSASLMGIYAALFSSWYYFL